jgi:uncharacterized protein (TIGR02217 family)
VSGFHDISFPAKIARGAVGGPQRQTFIATKANGIEVRNVALLHSKRRWEIATAGSSLDELHALLNFFEARMGSLFAFRFCDPIDFKSCLPSASPSFLDQIIGTGNATKTVFQLIKTYGDNVNQYTRPITLPVINTIQIGVAGVLRSPNTYSVDYQTGEVTFNAAPANGAAISAGFAFDNMVRFDNDALEMALDGANTGRINSISLVEVRL